MRFGGNMRATRWRTWVAGCALLAAACAASDDGGGQRVGAPIGSAGMAAANAGASGGGGLPAAAGGSGGGGSVAVPMAGVGAAGMGGTGGMAGAGGMAGMVATPMAGSGGAAAPAGSCPPAPDGVSPAAAEALEIVNAARLPAGAGCATMIPEINEAAQNHCDYYAANAGNDMCTANPHNEVMSCTGFTGEGPGDRVQAAGYTGRGSSEVMAFANDPARAIGQWINSVWHRIPILDPWTTHLGYGGADNCDTIDFGRGTPAPDDTVVLWPYEGQTGLPTTFDGSHEGPEPPEPPTGWPSATPITVYAQDLTVTEHVLTVDGDSAPIDHVWLTSADSNFLRSSIMMYANAPFTPNTTYRVKITGTYVGGALMREWTFTTGMGNRF
jgi:uncharacterized protein YkwD